MRIDIVLILYFNYDCRIGEKAQRLQQCFSPGVIDLVEQKSEHGDKVEQVAVVNKSGAR